MMRNIATQFPCFVDEDQDIDRFIETVEHQIKKQIETKEFTACFLVKCKTLISLVEEKKQRSIKH